MSSTSSPRKEPLPNEAFPVLSGEDRLAIDLPVDDIAECCRRRGIVELAVFGSVLTPERFSNESDVDFIATLAPHTSWSMGDLLAAEAELAAIAGRKADLVLRRNIQFSKNNLRRRSILTTARAVYQIYPPTFS